MTVWCCVACQWWHTVTLTHRFSICPTEQMTNSFSGITILSSQKFYFQMSSQTGPRSTISSKSDCRSRCFEFDPDLVPYFHGDWSWIFSTVILLLPLIQEGLVSALDKLLGQLGIYATLLSLIAYLQKQSHIFLHYNFLWLLVFLLNEAITNVPAYLFTPIVCLFRVSN